jgi:RNA polymerase sigma factor (sigma-70 family)
MEAALTRTDADAGPLTAEELCRRYSPSVCRFAAMIAGSSADADDLAQEALLRAVRAVGSYNPAKGPPEGWLWRIVVNAARDSARSSERARWLLERLMFAVPRELESVEAAVLARLRDEDLHAQIRLLPHRDRTLLGGKGTAVFASMPGRAGTVRVDRVVGRGQDADQPVISSIDTATTGPAGFVERYWA